VVELSGLKSQGSFVGREGEKSGGEKVGSRNVASSSDYVLSVRRNRGDDWLRELPV